MNNQQPALRLLQTAVAYPLRRQPILIVAVVVGIGLRLALAWSTVGNFDQVSYAIVADIMRRGGNIYAETIRYNYSPFWAYCLLCCANIAAAAQVPLAVVVRTLLTGVDLINALLLGLISVRLGASQPWLAFAAYLLNPVAIIIVGHHGQFENMAMLPILLAVWAALRRPDPSPLVTFLLGALALLIKHDTLFTVWMLFIYLTPTRRNAEAMLLGAFCLFALSFVPFLSEGANGIFMNVFAYTSFDNVYGLGVLLPRYLNRPIFYLAMVMLPFVARYRLRMPVVPAIELSLVALLALIYGFSEQYFILPVIVGSVRRSRIYWIYTGAAAIYLAGSKHNLDIPSIPSLANTVWLAAAAWCLSYILAWRVDAPAQPTAGTGA